MSMLPAFASAQTDNAENDSDRYMRFCRPLTGAKLKAANLDKTYHRAKGDMLYFYDEYAQEVAVSDFVGGYGGALFGHNHPDLIRAGVETLRANAPFLAQGSCRAAAGRLAKTLDELLYARTDFHYVTTLSSSGAEAVETAIKHCVLEFRQRLESWAKRARKQLTLSIGALQNDSSDILTLAEQLGVTEASVDSVAAQLEAHITNVASMSPVLLGVAGGFHGKTGSALQLTHNTQFRTPFTELGPATRFLRFESDGVETQIEALNVAVPTLVVEGGQARLEPQSVSPVAGLFIEPVQGEGGVVELPAEFVRRCREQADRFRFPLVFDEIQSGMGRCGRFLASEALGIAADYYLLGKSLGGGVAKIAACCIQRGRYIEEFGMLHTSTFAEDDFSAKIAIEALAIVRRENVPARCAA
ncbi:MAG: aminotransferase class III-fold pyridoxal phosphate-dependent enzyme [Gammaproteobacteria bacterium]|nr:aminotransferase class III-fold pyridoxal phosphate-dependent enzyme [Gammaproteobacteria bacterium]